MTSKLVLILALACAAALPLSAGHRHGRDCGHYYSRARGGWVAFSVVTPWGAGAFGRSYDRGRGYYGPGYYGDRRFFRNKGHYKRYLKQRRKYAKRHRHSRYCRH